MPKGTSKSTAIIQRLLEERRQYEAWIARLNESADATPGHVRARVRSDYEARLAAVTEELKAHAESARQAIEEKLHLRGELQKKEALAARKLTETQLRAQPPSARREAPPAPAPSLPEASDSAGDEQADLTLKCRECGTMNRPTEWYCQQCGAELAAF